MIKHGDERRYGKTGKQSKQCRSFPVFVIKRKLKNKFDYEKAQQSNYQRHSKILRNCGSIFSF